MRNPTLAGLIVCVFAAMGLMGGCSDDDSQGWCGNGRAEGAEECDANDLDNTTCDDLIPGSVGSLVCNPDCTFFREVCEVPPPCGDGLQQYGEDCDGDDLGGFTCADVVPGTTGTLACTGECLFDATGCVHSAICGDGVQNFGEHCDCGEDAGNLPLGCTAVNGGTNANCDLTCATIDLCGDGIQTGTEECDCGEPTLISAPAAACADYNGTPNSTCDDNCTLVPECLYGHFECDPLQGTPPEHDCCPDQWNNAYHCKPSMSAAMDNMCAMPCSTDSDCYWNNLCLGQLFPVYDLCYFAACGPGDLIDAQFYATCQLPSGQTGTCIPQGRYADTGDHYGHCLENGSIAHGAVCPNASLLATDRYADGGAASKMCNGGLCIGPAGANGICAAFCDWEAEYDAVILGSGASSCPAGSNCFSESTLSGDQVDPDYADYGWRRADLGYCLPTETTDPTLGRTTCSLVTGQLLSNTSLTCADTHTNGLCAPVTLPAHYRTSVSCVGNPAACVAPTTCDTSLYSTSAGWCVTEHTELGFGTLIGACTVGQANGLSAWSTCTLGTDLCPTGTWCAAENAFDDASGQARCLPVCDTQVHNGVTATCQDLGAPVTTPGGVPECTSISYAYLPWINGPLNGNGGADDPDRSRLGLCALPRP